MARRRTFIALGIFGVAGAFAAACGGDDNASPITSDGSSDSGSDATTVDGTSSDTNAPPPDANATDTASEPDAGDAGTDAAPVDRGPTTIPFNGDPSGLYWDYGSNAALYIADSANNAIVRWADVGGFDTAANLPPVPDGGTATLGQVIRLLDGTMLVTQLGYGQYGAVVVVSKSGDAGVVTGIVDGGPAPLSAKKRRIGLAILADGTIVDTYFTPVPDGGAGQHAGAIAKVNVLAGTEKDFVTGLRKPIGVVYNEGRIYVTDQDFGYLIRVGLDGGVFADPDAAPPDAGDDAEAGTNDGGDGGDAGDAGPSTAPSVFAALASPDLICQGPDGALFAGSTGGTVYMITRAGVVSSFATGLKSARGCAYDGAHKRLFVAEHDPATTSPQHAIRILPVP